jgi:hypothetical protein
MTQIVRANSQKIINRFHSLPEKDSYKQTETHSTVTKFSQSFKYSESKLCESIIQTDVILRSISFVSVFFLRRGSGLNHTTGNNNKLLIWKSGSHKMENAFSFIVLYSYINIPSSQTYRSYLP